MIFKLAILSIPRKFAKLNSSPNFPAIRYAASLLASHNQYMILSMVATCKVSPSLVRFGVQFVSTSSCTLSLVPRPSTPPVWSLAVCKNWKCRRAGNEASSTCTPVREVWSHAPPLKRHVLLLYWLGFYSDLAKQDVVRPYHCRMNASRIAIAQ